MTPRWIIRNANVTGGTLALPDVFVILQTTGNNLQRALRIQLVPPNILTSADDYTASITVALDPAAKDVTNDQSHNAIFGISDMKHFMGFRVFDHDEAHTCAGVAGDVGTSTLENVKWGSSTYVYAANYSSEVKIYIQPYWNWSSCHTELNDGTIQVATNLEADPKDGLYFEFYRDSPSEVYYIKYINIAIVQN